MMHEPITSRRVYICQNGKCASREQAGQVYEALQNLISQYERQSGEFIPVKVKLVGCLDICENGPNLVIHPDQIWYHKVTPAVLERIFNEHLLSNQPVPEWIYRQTNPGNSSKS